MNRKDMYFILKIKLFNFRGEGKVEIQDFF
ncbi:hypothetical protein SAMN05421766_101901 [Zobellia uliginosa]|uniref:Uncharacterized protein n=1 Tax=Zobellia uliginosa TaxID=143224 RepID=A0ABY1KJW1_9FLAO|nr:hypothetical protein SAMN05421766_101901 [Zobellia uliginosa]